MRRYALPLSLCFSCGFAAMIAFPQASEARVKIRLPGFNPIAGVVQGVGRALGIRGHRANRARHVSRPAKRSRAARSNDSARVAAGATGAAAAGAAALAANAGSGEAFWPYAYGDLLSYTFGGENGYALWAHGHADVTTSIFTNPNVAMASAETTGTVAPTSPSCIEDSSSAITRSVSHIEQRITLDDAQRDALNALREALENGAKTVAASCVDEVPTHATERLRLMTDRIWSLHVTGYVLREPLAKFYGTLNDEQKKQIDAAAEMPAPTRSSRKSAGALAAPDADPRVCMALAMRDAEWPAKQMTKTLKLDDRQQQMLRQVSKLSEQMQKSIVATCPQQQPATAMARLDAGLDRLDAMFYAANVMQPAVETFYGSLSDEQKERLNTVRNSR